MLCRKIANQASCEAALHKAPRHAYLGSHERHELLYIVCQNELFLFIIFVFFLLFHCITVFSLIKASTPRSPTHASSKLLLVLKIAVPSNEICMLKHISQCELFEIALASGCFEAQARENIFHTINDS